MVNTKAIRKRMIDLDLSYRDLGEAIGKKAGTARQKVMNYRPLFLDEAEAWQKVLQADDSEFHFYFFSRVSRSVNIHD